MNLASVTVGTGITSPEVRNVYSWLPAAVVMTIAVLSVERCQPVYGTPSFSTFPISVFNWDTDIWPVDAPSTTIATEFPSLLSEILSVPVLVMRGAPFLLR